MTRRDLIIVAVLANIGVLAILFMLAFRSDEQTGIENNGTTEAQVAYTLTDESAQHSQPAQTVAEAPQKPEPIDMIDAALDEEGLTDSHSLITGDDENFQLIEPESHSHSSLSANTPEEKVEPSSTAEQNPKFVSVTIKRGDALEKIARANGTTVENIMKANQLKNDRLRIGQTLQVPVGTHKKSAISATPKPKVSKEIAQGDNKTADAEYYTIKSGDNPWKIAKQFHLKLDDLLKLNNLNEEKARNLKIGDTIRVK